MTIRHQRAAPATADRTAMPRLDQALVEAGFFESRAKAQEAIAAGLVTVDGRIGLKAAARIAEDARLAASPAYPWVSRGGVKLAAALDRFDIDPRGAVCLDVGASTGGFTDVLLAHGAAHVYAVDVGRDQLHERVRRNPRVDDWSETDIRTVPAARFPIRPSLAVCDVSFISLTLVLPAIGALLAAESTLVALVKPQFEVGRGKTRRGLVRDDAARQDACLTVTAYLEHAGWTILGQVRSPIEGGDGNVEFLVGAQRR